MPALAEALRIDAPEYSYSGKEFTVKAYIGEEKQRVDWTSSDTDLATVNSSGEVSVKRLSAPAVVTFTATARDESGLSAQASVALYPLAQGIALFADGEALPETDALLAYDVGEIGNTHALTFTLVPEGANPLVGFSSSDEDVATVSPEGVLTLTGKGKATVTAVADGAKSVKQTLTVRVRTLVKAIAVSVPEEAAAGEKVKIASSVAPEDADNADLTYSVSPEDAGTVSSSGQLTLAKSFAAPTAVTVTATAEDGSGVSGSATLTAYPLAEAVVVQQEAVEMEQGKTLQIAYAFTPEQARAGVTFSSSKSSVLTVDETGLVTAVFPGQASVTIKPSSGKSATIDFTVIPTYDFTLTKEFATVTAYHSQDTDAVVPDTVNGLPVTAIAEGVFAGKTNLRTVTLPEGVTQLGNAVFKGCTALTRVTLPSTLTSIPQEAFAGCTSLSALDVPQAVTSIYEYAFLDCTALEALALPDGLTQLGAYAFSGCQSLRELTLPPLLSAVPDNLAERCASLERVTLPAGVTQIGRAAFYDCRSLAAIDLPAGVSVLGGGAFEGCTALKEFACPEGVTLLSADTFFGCTQLQSVTLPQNLSAIGVYAFAHCPALQTLTLPAGLAQLNAHALTGTSATLLVPEGSLAQRTCETAALAYTIIE